MRVTATNKISGEMVDLPADTFEDVVIAYRLAQEYEKLATRIKDQLKLIVPTVLDERGLSDVSRDGYQFRRYESQRSTYDKQALRDVFDEDEIDLFLTVNKTAVDSYIKDNPIDPERLALLRNGLIPAGKVTIVTRLEKVV